MKKILIVIRHAHRDKDLIRPQDNGLSSKGKKQAERLLKHFRKVYPGVKPLVVSSPRLRCVETVEAIARHTKTQLKTEAFLEEGGNLSHKVSEFREWWFYEAPELVVACSHGDWIPLFIGTLIGTDIDLKKGAWAEFHLEGERAKLFALIQYFKS